MKLTVAMRIVGGFSAILILLLFLGGTSYYSLSGISDSTNQVNSISIPALENSATLQSEFVKMSKISLQAFYSEEVKDIVKLEGQFNAEKNLYDTAAKALQVHDQIGRAQVLTAGDDPQTRGCHASGNQGGLRGLRPGQRRAAKAAVFDHFEKDAQMIQTGFAEFHGAFVRII